MSVAYLADEGRFEADAAAGFRLLELNDQPVPHAERMALSVVADRSYRAPRRRFPFNLLRNIAVSASPADFVCLVDVDFVAYPQRQPGCPGCHAAAKLRRWLPLLRLSPHLALVLPAFDSNPTVPSAAAAMRALSGKRSLRQLVRRGAAETFAYRQYPLGHQCDDSARWLSSSSPYHMEYSFGCEPYLLYNRRKHR